MKNKFEVFNNIKIDTEEYEEVYFSNNEDFKKIMKSKIKVEKNMKKRKVIATSVGVLIGSMVIASEPSLAYIRNIGKQIEYFFRIEEDALSGYKIELNQVIEENGIKIELKEIMLEDGELLLSLIVDDSKLDKSYFGVDAQKQKDMWPYLDEPKVTIGDMVFARTGGAMSSEQGDEKSRNMLLTCSLNELDTNDDGESDVLNFDLISNLEMNKNYDIKIEIDKVNYTIENSTEGNTSLQEMEIPDYIEIEGTNGGGVDLDSEEEFTTKTGSVLGNWTFESSINANKLLDDIEIYDIKEEFTINYKDVNIDVLVEEVRISPTKIKIKRSFKVDGEFIGNEIDIPKYLEFIVQDEKGHEIEVRGGVGLDASQELIERVPYAEGELNRKIESIKIIPVIDDWGKKYNSVKKFKDDAFTLELQ